MSKEKMVGTFEKEKKSRRLQFFYHNALINLLVGLISAGQRQHLNLTNDKSQTNII